MCASKMYITITDLHYVWISRKQVRRIFVVTEMQIYYNIAILSPINSS